jgi:hypothetical protein
MPTVARRAFGLPDPCVPACTPGARPGRLPRFVQADGGFSAGGYLRRGINDVYRLAKFASWVDMPLASAALIGP